MQNLNLDFSGAPTIWKFLNDKSFVRGIMGPVGSGKSYACASEIMLKAINQKPSPKDGIKYTRFVIVRNSYPELRTTTIKTWQEIFPENIWGSFRWSPPLTHHIKLPSRDNAPGVDCEVIFLALDQPKDVRKLLSMELTGAWINEARELPKAVIDGLTHRVGRYPTKADGGPTWRGVWMDTNPMDDDHWWYRLAEKEKMRGKYAWKFFKQPPAVAEVTADDLPKNPEANGFVFSTNKWWSIAKPENKSNLPTGYYEQILQGKNLDWIRCYAQAKYTYVQEGKPVMSEYDDQTMIAESLEPDITFPIQIGLDFGLTPAAVFGQKMGDGRWHILHELVSFDMGLQRFGHLLKSELESHFPKYEVMIWGDPSGVKRDEIFEVTAFQHLQSLGLLARPTVSNVFRVRREAGSAPMNRLMGGKPGLLINRKCVRLRKALSGGYHFKRVQVSGHERFRDEPNKNEHSHVGDAYMYLTLGGGEHKQLIRGNRQPMKQYIASTEFNIL